MEGKDMDIRERYAKFVQAEIRENANPYPTGIQGFVAGVASEFQRVIDILQDHVCPSCERGEYLHESCEGLLSSIDLLRTKSK
jgi:Cu2+-containing amine oxidase